MVFPVYTANYVLEYDKKFSIDVNTVREDTDYVICLLWQRKTLHLAVRRCWSVLSHYPPPLFFKLANASFDPVGPLIWLESTPLRRK